MWKALLKAFVKAAEKVAVMFAKKAVETGVAEAERIAQEQLDKFSKEEEAK